MNWPIFFVSWRFFSRSLEHDIESSAISLLFDVNRTRSRPTDLIGISPEGLWGKYIVTLAQMLPKMIKIAIEEKGFLMPLHPL